MIIEKKACDFWDEVYNRNGNQTDQPYDAVCCDITKTVRGNGMLVMESEIAKSLNDQFPGTSEVWGSRMIKDLHNNGVMANPTFIKRENQPEEFQGNVELVFLVSFPTREEYKKNADIVTIEQSTVVLKLLADTMGWDKVLIEAPGIRNGLDWDKEVKPLLNKYLDTRFTVVINE